MKIVGIIGGIGPASTLDYYNGIINGARMDNNYPEIIINSVNMTEMLSYVEKKDWDALVSMLVCAIKKLADAGAEFAAIASNTPHIVFDRIQKQAALPLVSIVESTCKYASSVGCRKAVVIGTRFTMSSGLYTEAFNKYDIAVVVPPENEQEAIHNIIFPKLEDGIVVPEDKQKMLEIVNTLIKEHNADTLVLGCTELPLMIKNGDLDVLLLNTTQIHIDEIINQMRDK
jgi:aspartate racemase